MRAGIWTLICLRCFVALTRAPLTIGYEDHTTQIKLERNRGFERAYNVRLPAGPHQHEVERNLNLIRGLDQQLGHIVPKIFISIEQRQWAREWLGDLSGSFLLVLGLPATDAKTTLGMPDTTSISSPKPCRKRSGCYLPSSSSLTTLTLFRSGRHSSRISPCAHRIRPFVYRGCIYHR